MNQLILTILVLVCYSISTISAQNPLNLGNKKDAFQIGVFGGVSTLVGDVEPNIFNANKPGLPGYYFGLHISKSWTHFFATRLRYSTLMMQTNDGTISSLTQEQITGINKVNDIGFKNFVVGQDIFHNSRTQGHDLNLDMVFSFGNRNKKYRHSTIIFKAFPSIGMLLYNTHHDHIDKYANNYDYTEVEYLTKTGSEKKKALIYYLGKSKDGIYETKAAELNDSKKLLGYNTRFTYGIGGGLTIRVNDFLSIDIESRQTFVNDDLLDGMKWQNNGNKHTLLTNDSYNQTTLGLTFSLIGKNIDAPLTMQNPFWDDDQNILLTEEILNGKEDLLNSTDLTNNPKDSVIKDSDLSIETNRINIDIENNTEEQTNENQLDPYKFRNGDNIYVSHLKGEIQAEYYIIIGSFREKGNAKRDKKNWLNKRIKTYIQTDKKNGLHRLIVDYTDDHSEALILLAKYQEILLDSIWLIKEK